MATQPDADGWIEWAGGECPVDAETIVDIRFRSGVAQVASQAGTWLWTHAPARGRTNPRSDIIAYRVVSL